MKHCDDYIDDPLAHPLLRLFLAWARSPGHGLLAPRPWPVLFATVTAADAPPAIRDKRVRVTMASRLGDVGVTADLACESGYDYRLHVADLGYFTDGTPSAARLGDEEFAALEACQSAEQWNQSCAKIKAARDGQFPDDWFARVVTSGMMHRVFQRWKTPT